MILTAKDLTNFIAGLSRSQYYHYPNESNRKVIKIVQVELPEGPIRIQRINHQAGGSEASAPIETISSSMLWRLANALQPGIPINVDRVFAGSYNTRSVLEALLLNASPFYTCYPGRIEPISGSAVVHGNRHIVWQPNNSHPSGELSQIEIDAEVSEIPAKNVLYDALRMPDADQPEIDRRHAQIQYALSIIGDSLGLQVWIAKGDRSLTIGGTRFSELPGVLGALADTLLGPYPRAIEPGQWVDCIWFDGSLGMPAVIEVEHSTGVTSGLSRMKAMQDFLPGIQTLYVISAPDEDRAKVLHEIMKPQFTSLNAVYLPYSAVEELLYLSQKRGMSGASSDFIKNFSEDPRADNEGR